MNEKKSPRAERKELERILTEALGPGWREIREGVYLAPVSPPPAESSLKQILEELI